MAKKLEGTPFNLDGATVPFATDGLQSPTIFAESIRGATVGPEIAKLNLIENRIDAHSGEIRAIHVATLVLPTSQIAAWADFLGQLAESTALASETKQDG